MTITLFSTNLPSYFSYSVVLLCCMSVSFYQSLAQDCIEVFGITSPSSSVIEPVQVEPSNGDLYILTSISSSPISVETGSTTINANNQEMTFIQTGIANSIIKTIDTNGGNVVQTSGAVTNISNFQYNCRDEVLYGLYQVDPTTVQVAQIDPTNGNTTILTAFIPIGGAVVAGASTLDNTDGINDRYFFMTLTAGIYTVHIVDLTSGAVSNFNLSFIPLDMAFDLTDNSLLFLGSDLSIVSVDVSGVPPYTENVVGTVAASPVSLATTNMVLDPFDDIMYFTAEETTGDYVLYSVSSIDANFIDPLAPSQNLPYAVSELVAAIPCEALPNFSYTGGCLGDITFFTNESLGGNSFTWDFGDPDSGGSNVSTEENPLHVYVDAGTYTVTLTIDGCVGSNSTSQDIVIIDPPTPNLSSPNDLIPLVEDTVRTCASSLTLVAQEYPDASYTWITGPGGNEITASVSTWYWVEIDLNGCVVLDSVFVDIGAQIESPNLFASDTLTICGVSGTIDAGVADAEYLWSPNGETTQTISVSTSQLYTVTVTQDDCEIVDEVFVNVVADLTVDLGEDVVDCGEDYVLDAGAFVGATYLWSTGDNSQTISADNAGEYWVEVTIGDCMDRDTIEVQLVDFVAPNLGPDTLRVCETTPLTLDATATGASYLWSTNEDTPSIDVLNTAPGLYWVEVQVGACVERDSIIVEFGPEVTVDLGPDISACPGELVTLSSGLNDAITHVWSTNEFANTIEVTESGTYSVLVDNGYCIDDDEIVVDIPESITVDLGTDLSICPLLNESINLDAGDGTDFIWSTGDTSSSIDVTQPGIYSVTVSNSAGCTSEGETSVTTVCETAFLLPNAFSPNGDNVNDYFRPQTQFVENYSLQVYDRWGKVLFATTNLDDAWDGTNKGETQPMGVYVWFASYTDNAGNVIKEKGNVTIVY